MQKAADISVLFFSAVANFWAILGHFWAIFGAIFLWQNMHLCYLNFATLSEHNHQGDRDDQADKYLFLL